MCNKTVYLFGQLGYHFQLCLEKLQFHNWFAARGIVLIRTLGKFIFKVFNQPMDYIKTPALVVLGDKIRKLLPVFFLYVRIIILRHELIELNFWLKRKIRRRSLEFRVCFVSISFGTICNELNLKCRRRRSWTRNFSCPS